MHTLTLAHRLKTRTQKTYTHQFVTVSDDFGGFRPGSSTNKKFIDTPRESHTEI